MTTTPRIQDFLEARIAEDEAIAGWKQLYVKPKPPWSVDEQSRVEFAVEVIDAEGIIAAHARGEVIADHIARWDPARVLAECQAKRAILWLHHRNTERSDCPTCESSFPHGCQEQLVMAAVYAGHPDFDLSWISTDAAWRRPNDQTSANGT